MSASFHAEATESTPNGLRLTKEGLLRAEVLVALRKAEVYLVGVSPRRSTTVPSAYTWLRLTPGGRLTVKPVTLRTVIAGTESYTPARRITQQAIDHAHSAKGLPSAYHLKYQLREINESSIVLNRAARELAEKQIANGVSMNELAMRAQQMRSNRTGSRSSPDQSWLRRRLGIVPHKAANGEEPTPWIHDSVLAKIAAALNVAPREIELGAYDD